MDCADLSGLQLDPAFVGDRVAADLVADRLRDAIQLGVLPDGATLNQAALAQRFAVSRQPIREAIRQLMAEGLIESRAHHGAVVRRLSAQTLLEIYDNRATLEGYMLERAVGQIPASVIAELHEHNASTSVVADIGDWLSRSHEFHDRLLRHAGDGTAMELVSQLRVRAERYVRRWLGPGGREQPDLAAGEHEHVLRACAAGDGAVARSVLESHIRNTGRRLIDLAVELRSRQ